MKHYDHETTVLGLFKDTHHASEAIHILRPLGYKTEDISLIYSKEDFQEEELINFPIGEKLHPESMRAGKIGGITGAVVGGATGMAATLTGGLSLFATIPLVMLITGASGVLGAYLNAGFTEEIANVVDNKLAEGEVLVLVHAKDRQLAKLAQETLQNLGAEEVRTHH